MKKFLLVVIVAAVAAIAITYGLRKSWHTSSAAVTSLLPRDTLALAYLPDLNRARNEWRQTDLYQIWMEPDVQKFLRKPRSRLPSTIEASEALADLDRLGMRNGFVAITSVEAQAVGIASGFEFSDSAAEAEKIVNGWRDKWLAKMPEAKRETVDYEKHKIETVTHGLLVVATTFDGDWFFAANNLEVLKTTLDRADGRMKDKQSTLAADEIFAKASSQMPRNLATMFFLRLDQAVEKILPALSAGQNLPPDSLAELRKFHSFCWATSFDGGKMRETAFVAAEKEASPDLTRATLALTSAETFLYNASVANFNQVQIAKWMDLAGIKPDDFAAAVGSEFSLVAEWPSGARWPSFVATLPIKDQTKAREIVARLTAGKNWSQEDRNGVGYFKYPSAGGLFSLSPTVAITPKFLIAGADPASVEITVQRTVKNGPDVSATAKFKSVEREVGAPQRAFGYFDLALFYTRLDAALRPILIMGAAFMPGISDTVDLGELPAPEVITKHLSPTVLSRRQVDGGFLSESVGTITASQGGAGLGAIAMLGTYIYQTQLHHNATLLGNFLPALSVSPGSSTPTPAPAGTP